MNKETIKESIRKGYLGAVMRHVPEVFRDRYNNNRENDAELERIGDDIIEWCDAGASKQEKMVTMHMLHMGNIEEVIHLFPPNLQAKWSSIKKLERNLMKELIGHIQK